MLRGRQIIRLLLFLLISFAAGGIGSLFTAPAVVSGGWYSTLMKPPWTPPNWLFAPVWSTLYLLMGIAGWLVWRKAGGLRTAAAPMTLFALQLVLNTAWSIIFFGLHQLGLAVLDSALLWFFILLTLISFWQVLPLAGALLLPYLLWVSYATALTVAIYRYRA